jgi:DNA (cytosine-5)-methyltransferase 1
MNYYNEWDSFAAEWLKQLIKDGLIPDGEVDSRSIADVEPEELKGFTQCHFFAGIGGWSRALQIAGWSPDRPVWTGSPPCQSFSTAGKRKGKDDERHLWPVFFNLIRECQPPTVFGEQVAAAIRFGWLDDLQIDFEKEGYAAGAFVLPAGSIGAPHKRERLFFVADSDFIGYEGSGELGRSSGSEENKDRKASSAIKPSASSLADPNHSRPQRHGGFKQQYGKKGWQNSVGYSGESSEHCSVGNPNGNRPQERHEATETARHGDSIDSASFWSGSTNSVADSSSKQKHQEQQKPAENEGKRSAINNSRCSVDDEGLWDLWENSQIIYCRDGKHRPIPTEPALFPLADGISNRVGILRGAGNAIVPQAAAEIIKAVM